jgi:hypothetical protein
MDEKKKPVIRMIYLYLFTILGLVLLTIGGVGFANMALKEYVFTKADIDYYSMQPPMPYALEKTQEIADDEGFTEEERASARQWIVDYNMWQENVKANDYRRADRHRSAAQNLALIIIGLPLYLFHWRMLRKEYK